MVKRAKAPKKRVSRDLTELEARRREVRERRRLAKKQAREARKLLKQARRVAKRAKAELQLLGKKLKKLLASAGQDKPAKKPSPKKVRIKRKAKTTRRGTSR